jgi:hypothetical protein
MTKKEDGTEYSEYCALNGILNCFKAAHSP